MTGEQQQLSKGADCFQSPKSGSCVACVKWEEGNRNWFVVRWLAPHGGSALEAVVRKARLRSTSIERLKQFNLAKAKVIAMRYKSDDGPGYGGTVNSFFRSSNLYTSVPKQRQFRPLDRRETKGGRGRPLSNASNAHNFSSRP